MDKLTKWLFWGFWIGLFYTIWNKMLVLKPDSLYAGWVNVWGDWAAHLSYATSFGYGANYGFEMPILDGARFGYPFMADFVSGVLMKLRVDMISAMVVPGFIMSMFLVGALYKFGKEITKGLKEGMVLSLLFLFNGGLGFWWWFKDIKTFGFIETLKALPREYTHLEKIANIEWINIITSQVVPQRGFLMGFPIAIMIYLLLWKRHVSKKKINHKLLGWAGLLGSILPLVHAHSFVLTAWVAGWLMIIELIKGGEITVQLIKEWWWYWLPMIIIGLPQVVYFFGGSLGKEGFIRWQPGWMVFKDNSNWFWFWFKNLGFSLILALMGMRLASKKLRLFSLPFWGLFFIANLWIFQPWEWDNTKILTHWYLMASLLGALTVVKGFKVKNWMIKTVTGVVLILSLWAGFLDAVRLTQFENLKIKFFSKEELNLADWVKTNTDKKAKFLTASNHDHWVPVLTGRQIILGFKGWLWTYGLDYFDQELAVKQMFKGGDKAIEKLDDYKVDYVIAGPKERQEMINEEFYEDNFELVYKLGETKIYQVRNLENSDILN